MSSYRWMTPPAPAGVALLCCDALPALLDKAAPAVGRAGLRHLVDPQGAIVDEVVVWTLSEQEWEIGSHGGPGIRQAIDAALQAHGYQPDAQPRQDPQWQALAQAPSPAAVAVLVNGQADRVPAQWLHRPPVILVTGPVNAGKSTLVNAWCGHARALVSDIPGTTRDLLTAEVLCHGWRLRVIDSAGLRRGADALEQAGQDLARAAREWADLVIHLQPVDRDPDPDAPALSDDICVYGKIDLLPDPPAGLHWAGPEHVGEAEAAQMLEQLGLAVLSRLKCPPGTAERLLGN